MERHGGRRRRGGDHRSFTGRIPSAAWSAAESGHDGCSTGGRLPLLGRWGPGTTHRRRQGAAGGPVLVHDALVDRSAGSPVVTEPRKPVVLITGASGGVGR